MRRLICICVLTVSDIHISLAEIDRQHQQLLGAIAELEKYVDTDYSFSAFLTAETTLLDYTKAHFEFEEQLMAEWKLPELEEHRQEHQRLVKEVEALWLAIEAGENLGHYLLTMLKEWIIEHINEEVERFKAFGVSTTSLNVRDSVELLL